MKTAKIIGIAILILVGVDLLPATRDTLAWHFASSGDQARNYAEYLAAWPSGRHSAEARSRHDERSWADAQAGKTLESYRQYERTHPSGAHLADARAQIEDLTWRQASDTGTVGSLQAYAETYPEGKFVTEAQSRIEDLAWRQASSTNTIRSLRAYAEAYPKGKFLTEAKSRQLALRTDDAPWTMALQKGTKTALDDFLSEFPGHAKEADARQAIQDITEGRDIVDLLAEKKIEIQAQGSGIQSVRVRIRRLVPYPLSIRVPVGSYFVSARQSAQNMVTTAESKVRLTTGEWQSISVPAACANRPKDIPGSQDSFTVRRSPHQKELVRLMPLLDKASVPYATRQAAVWIVTDNASYSDLGILVSRPQFQPFGGTRTIREAETARAMKICAEAGIDITRKRIWSDRRTILRGLSDADLKKWLEEKR
ncbi:MAG: hypothetical protein LBE85_07420 [Candidatus Accumulibacter sp.]|jgi:hypothetical protein|nr:hypothetical protein [Accumulibacter sp.]